MLRSQNHINTNEFLRKIDWNVELITVDDAKLRRECVTNKEKGHEKGRMYKRIEFVEQKKERKEFSWSHQLRCLELVFCFFLGLPS